MVGVPLRHRVCVASARMSHGAAWWPVGAACVCIGCVVCVLTAAALHQHQPAAQPGCTSLAPATYPVLGVVGLHAAAVHCRKWPCLHGFASIGQAGSAAAVALGGSSMALGRAACVLACIWPRMGHQDIRPVW
jgi:hypothetical protein